MAPSSPPESVMTPVNLSTAFWMSPSSRRASTMTMASYFLIYLLLRTRTQAGSEALAHPEERFGQGVVRPVVHRNDAVMLAPPFRALLGHISDPTDTRRGVRQDRNDTKT